MTLEEAGKLLVTCATFDRRKVGPLDVIAWHRVLGDLRHEDCEAAALAHYGESTEWVMPAHIRNRVREARRIRVEDAEVPAPPPELIDDPPAYRAWLRNATIRIADGEDPAAIESKPLRGLGSA